jgi:hypothetical protein
MGPTSRVTISEDRRLTNYAPLQSFAGVTEGGGRKGGPDKDKPNTTPSRR